MKKAASWSVGFIISGLFFISCQKNKFDIDVSDIPLEISIRRMEKEFFNPSGNLLQNHHRLSATYGSFYQRYIENITGIGLLNDPAIDYGLGSFINDKYVKEVYLDTEKKFPGDLDDIRQGLTEALKHALYYFPQMTVPEVVTYVSGFQYAMAVTDSTLGIGLDMYLGKDYINYTKAGIPQYKINFMTADYIVADAMKAWLMTEFFSDEKQSRKDLITTMIQHGKIMVLLDAVLPETPDTIKSGYTKTQFDWCGNNEFNIWAHLVDNELLFTTDPQVITKFFNEAPFTSGFPKESPPKIGVWVGHQIVKSFMDQDPGISIPMLMNWADAHELLKKSRYKPKQ